MTTANTYRQNGQYNLRSLVLTFENGDQLDLRNMFLDITLYESIFTPTMSGNISIVDTTNQINRNFIGNGEEIFIEYGTAGTSDFIRYYGRVYKVSPPTRMGEHSTGLILYFCSHEMINEKRLFVQDSFNTEVSNIVRTLFKRFRNRKDIDTVKSKDIHKFVGASQTPMEVISLLSRRAISSNNEHGYVFYEDTRQFNFKPLQNLYQQESVSRYSYGQAGVYDNVDKKEEEAFNKIQDFEFESISDFLEQIDDGVLGSSLETLNLLDKDIVNVTYDNETQFNRSNALGKSPNLRNSLVNKDYTDVKEFDVDITQSPKPKNKFFNIRELLKTQRFIAKINVFGDSNITVGSIIECVLPIWGTEALNDTKVDDPFSGRCLITEIKHTLKRTAYTQSMKIIKDSFEVGI